MRRTTPGWMAAIAAAVLLLAGCSSSVGGSAQVGSTPATTTSTSSNTVTPTQTTESSETETTGTTQTETSETETGTSGSGTSGTGTSGTETSTRTSAETSGAVTLDPATVKWFTAFCGRASDVTQYVSPNTRGQTLKQAQATVVDAYSNISISASTSVGLLQAIPPPTVDGGADLQSNAIESFTAVSDVYGRGAQTIAALQPRSVADLKKAIDAVEAEATATIPNTMAKVDPSVVEAARRLPACKGVLAGG